MPIFLASFSFSQAPLWGWVEQFWWEGNSLEDCIQAGRNLATARYRLLGDGVNLHTLRLSVPETPRAGLSVPLSGSTRPLPAVPAPQAVEVRLTGRANRSARRSYKLGGWPINGVLVGPAGADWSPALAAAGRAYLDLLTTGGWRLLVTIPLAASIPLAGMAQVALEGANAYGAPIDETDPDPANTLLYLQLSAPPDRRAVTVRLSGAVMQPNTRRVRRAVNGTHEILVNDGQGIYVQGTLGSGTYYGGGRVQLYQPGWVPITSAELIRLTGRKVGPATAGPSQEPPPQLAPQLVGPGGAGPVVRADAPSPPVEQTNEYLDAKEMASEVFAGYERISPTQTQKIGLAQVVGTERATYVLFLSGVDTGTRLDTLPQWVDALQALIQLPDSYTSEVRRILRENTPDGADIIVCGHSLGGIAGQTLFGRLANLGTRRPILFVGFGCPSMTYDALASFSPGGNLISDALTGAGFGPPPARIFAVRGDPVIWLTPAGDWFWFRYIAALGTGGATELVLFLQNQIAPFNIVYVQEPGGVFPNPFRLHMSYPDCLSLVQYAWDGRLDPEGKIPPLRTGRVQRFPWPPLP